MAATMNHSGMAGEEMRHASMLYSGMGGLGPFSYGQVPNGAEGVPFSCGLQQPLSYGQMPHGVQSCSGWADSILGGSNGQLPQAANVQQMVPQQQQQVQYGTQSCSGWADSVLSGSNTNAQFSSQPHSFTQHAGPQPGSKPQSFAGWADSVGSVSSSSPSGMTEPSTQAALQCFPDGRINMPPSSLPSPRSMMRMPDFKVAPVSTGMSALDAFPAPFHPSILDQPAMQAPPAHEMAPNVTPSGGVEPTPPLSGLTPPVLLVTEPLAPQTSVGSFVAISGASPSAKARTTAKRRSCC